VPIKNYTTKVDPARTASEITRILAGFRASRIQQEFDDDGDLVSLSFAVRIADAELFYRLPARAEGVLETLKRDGAEPRYCTMEHAKRVAWRIVKDWIDAQLALVDAGGATVEEVFFPYMLVSAEETVFERIQRAGGVAQLAAGGPLRLLTDGGGA
jgi:hypothetical protein